MTALISIFVAQFIDPVRIILVFAATFFVFKSYQRGERFTPLSIVIIAVAGLMSLLLSMIAARSDANAVIISFACGLFSTGALVGAASIIFGRLFR